MVIMCIDCCSQMVQLVLLQESNTQTMDDKFLSIVVSQHGLPVCIMSDCDPQFSGQFWDEIISLRYYSYL